MDLVNRDRIFYFYDGVKYINTFPLEWASNHLPETGPAVCKRCADFGTWNGVFIGYCVGCASDYHYTRGCGFEYPGRLMNIETLCEEDVAQPAWESSEYLKSIDLEEIPLLHGEADTKDILCLDAERGRIIEETGKIFFMGVKEHGQFHTCSHTTSFAEFVRYHYEYIQKCLAEDEQIAAAIPPTWRRQRIPGKLSSDEEPMTREEELLYYARADYITKTFQYKQGDFDLAHIFVKAKELQKKQEEIDHEIREKVNAQMEEDDYYEKINAYVDDRADYSPEFPNFCGSSGGYGSHYDEGYESF